MRKYFTPIVAIIALAALAVTAATALASQAPPKVIVCKYVGQPGVDERLQTGQNPISVSQNALKGKGFAGVFPFEFSDAQGRSVAIRFATGPTDNGSVDECPAPEGPPEGSVVVEPSFGSTPATCDSAETLIVNPVEGIIYDVVGELTGPGDVTVNMTVEEGFVLKGESSITFHLAGPVVDGCTKGEHGGGGDNPPTVIPAAPSAPTTIGTALPNTL